ncbi:hypothetical protein HDU80_008244 [Chytriomyces hyalinus]|nr:hypothetical protein HDU80_008244 [Chytriomyces hyalinus]
MSDTSSDEIKQQMAFRRRWDSVTLRMKTDPDWTSVLTFLRSQQFAEAARALGELHVKGDSDAQWVMSHPDASPVSDAVLAEHIARVCEAVLLDTEKALLWRRAAAERAQPDACVTLALALMAQSVPHPVHADLNEAFQLLLRASSNASSTVTSKDSPNTVALNAGRDNDDTLILALVLVSECFAYGVGTEQSPTNAMRRLDSVWTCNDSMLAFLAPKRKSQTQRVAAKMLAVWHRTGKPPVVPLFVPQQLCRSVDDFSPVQIDLAKADMWDARAST